MRFNATGMIGGLALMALPAMAFGQEGTSDADCSDGDVCMTPPCAEIAGPPGEDCPEV